MKKDFIHEEIDKKVDMDFSFDEIRHKVDCDKYEKQQRAKKPFLIIGVTTTVVTALIAISLHFALPDNSDNSTSNVETGSNISIVDGTPFFKYKPYDGNFVKNLEGINMNSKQEGPSYLYTIADAFTPNDSDYELCEVNFSFTNSQTVGAYMKNSTAEKIYNKYKNVDDVKSASPLTVIDGSVVEWFYNDDTVYDKDDIMWVEYEDNQLPLIINKYRLVGFYILGTSTVKRVIDLDEKVLKTCDYYQAFSTKVSESYFKPDNGISINLDQSDSSRWFFINTKNLDVTFFDRLEISNCVGEIVDGKLTVRIINIETDYNSTYIDFLDEVETYFVSKTDNSTYTYQYENFVNILKQYLGADSI